MAIRWTINLEDLKHGTHVVETKEGARREGKITEVTFTTQLLYGQEVRTPATLIINNDQSDFIQWELIKSISRKHGAAE